MTTRDVFGITGKRRIRRRGENSRRWRRVADLTIEAATRLGYQEVSGPYWPSSRDMAKTVMIDLMRAGRCPKTVFRGCRLYVWAKIQDFSVENSLK